MNSFESESFLDEHPMLHKIFKGLKSIVGITSLSCTILLAVEYQDRIIEKNNTKQGAFLDKKILSGMIKDPFVLDILYNSQGELLSYYEPPRMRDEYSLRRTMMSIAFDLGRGTMRRGYIDGIKKNNQLRCMFAGLKDEKLKEKFPELYEIGADFKIQKSSQCL